MGKASELKIGDIFKFKPHRSLCQVDSLSTKENGNIEIWYSLKQGIGYGSMEVSPDYPVRIFE